MGMENQTWLSALLVRIIRIAPRLYDYHGLSKFRNPISSSLYPFCQFFRLDCTGIAVGLTIESGLWIM